MSAPEPHPEPAPASGEPSGLRRPSTVGGVAYLVVCSVAALGLLLVAVGPWRQGVSVLGAAMLFAGAMRLVLSGHDAGMLRVRRNRFVDVAMLVAVGASLMTLAQVIPDQPG